MIVVLSTEVGVGRAVGSKVRRCESKYRAERKDAREATSSEDKIQMSVLRLFKGNMGASVPEEG